MKINGIECYLDHMKDTAANHAYYFHKVMSITKEYKDRPRDGCDTTYYILESKLPKRNYPNIGSLTDDDWYIIYEAKDVFEVRRVLSWLRKFNHGPVVEIKDAEVYID